MYAFRNCIWTLQICSIIEWLCYWYFSLSSGVLLWKYLVNVFDVEFWAPLPRLGMFEINTADGVSGFSILGLSDLLVFIRFLLVVELRDILPHNLLHLRIRSLFPIFHRLPELKSRHAPLAYFVQLFVLVISLNIFTQRTWLTRWFLFIRFRFVWVINIIVNYFGRSTIFFYLLSILILKQRLNHNILRGISNLSSQTQPLNFRSNLWALFNDLNFTFLPRIIHGIYIHLSSFFFGDFLILLNGHLVGYWFCCVRLFKSGI